MYIKKTVEASKFILISIIISNRISKIYPNERPFNITDIIIIQY